MTVRHAVVIAMFAWSCTGGDTRAPVHNSPARGTNMSQPGYPNVHARLRLMQRAPATPDRDSELEIWLTGTRFRVRDLTHRRVDEILADLTAPRGLGAPARTMEDLMDLHASERARANRDVPPTELFGDLGTGEGWVYPSKGARWPMAANELAPAAEQILARNKVVGLQIGPSSTRLGRTATEYRGFVVVTVDGEQHQNAVTRVIAAPYLLLENVRDAGNAGLSYVREVVSLDDGSVTDADVTPR